MVGVVVIIIWQFKPSWIHKGHETCVPILTGFCLVFLYYLVYCEINRSGFPLHSVNALWFIFVSEKNLLYLLFTKSSGEWWLHSRSLFIFATAAGLPWLCKVNELLNWYRTMTKFCNISKWVSHQYNDQ